MKIDVMKNKTMKIEDLISMAEIPFYGTMMKSQTKRDSYARYYKKELESLYKLKREGTTHIDLGIN